MSRAVRAAALSALIVLTFTACATSKPDRLANRVLVSSTSRQEAPGSTLEGLGQVARSIEYAGAVHAQAVAAYTDAMLAAEIAAKQAQLAELEHQDAQLAALEAAVAAGPSTGCAIPAYICERESGGDPTVYNTAGSGASGKYQFMPRTWNGYGGYANAADAPEWVQDQKAAELWAGGAGCSHWSAC